MNSNDGHPAAYKTIVLHDNIIRDDHEKELFSNHVFESLECDRNGNLRWAKHKDVWFISYNGHLKWSCLKALISTPLSYEEVRFSELLESLRKDIECYFGILKTRFSFLRNGLRTHSIKIVMKCLLIVVLSTTDYCC